MQDIDARDVCLPSASLLDTPDVLLLQRDRGVGALVSNVPSGTAGAGQRPRTAPRARPGARVGGPARWTATGAGANRLARGPVFTDIDGAGMGMA
jgi:hypothetical protein